MSYRSGIRGCGGNGKVSGKTGEFYGEGSWVGLGEEYSEEYSEEEVGVGVGVGGRSVWEREFEDIEKRIRKEVLSRRKGRKGGRE